MDYYRVYSPSPPPPPGFWPSPLSRIAGLLLEETGYERPQTSSKLQFMLGAPCRYTILSFCLHWLTNCDAVNKSNVIIGP